MLRTLFGAVGLVLLAALLFAASRLVGDPLRFPVSNVDVLGTLDYTDRDTLQQSIAEFTGRGFYALDIEALHQAVASLQWVASVRISRIWPGRLSVELQEHEPAARWNAHELISKQLVRFAPPQLQHERVDFEDWREVFSDLPALSGAPGRHAALLDAWRHYTRRLAPFGVAVKALHEDKRRSRSLRLSNGVSLKLGVEHRDARLARFLDVFERLVEPLEGKPARFDMRYSNGFALRGKPAVLGQLSAEDTGAGS